MNQVLFNQFGRLRSGWRAIIFLLSFIFVSAGFGKIIELIQSNSPVDSSSDGSSKFVFPNFILLTVSIFLGWLCGKFLENLPFRALGCWFTKNWLKDFIVGLILGAISILFAVLIAVIFGGMTLQYNSSSGSTAIRLTLIMSLAVFTLGAAAEEAFFRGYILQTFARAKLAWFAIAMTSLFFASGHLGNPNANHISTVNTVLAGVWFSIAYLKTRNLWLAFGLHLMWNWMQGAILGIPVSGITELTTAPLFQVSDSGATALTGGNYGIEGGIACTIAIAASSVLIWFLPFLKPADEMSALTNEEIPAESLT